MKLKLKQFKWPIIWIIIYAISLYIMGYFLRSLNYNLWYLFLIGFGVTLISRIVRTFTADRGFSLDKSFLFWGIVNTFFIWVVWLGLDNFNISTSYEIRLLLTGIGLFLGSKLLRLKRRVYKHKGMIAIIFLFLLLYVNWADVSSNFDDIELKKDEYIGEIDNLIDEVEENDNIEKIEKSVENDEINIEENILKLVNEERGRNGVGSLRFDSSLNNMAKTHSERMLEEGFFEHSNYNVGENIFMTPKHYWVEGCGVVYTDNQVASCVVSGWIDSPGHHTNMIDASYSITGIGVACDLFECKATQTFS
ncbi:MAG: CAP domain-containing protein [Candidatus Woesearchaeota archaeon]